MRYIYKHLLKASLTRNQRIGYWIERTYERQLRPWIVKSTPFDPVEWKKCIGKGADFILKGDIEVECKYVNHWVYESAIRNCYLPRFSKNAKEKIVLTNNKRRFTRRARELLRESGIKLMTISELVKYLLEGYCIILVKGIKEIKSLRYFFSLVVSKGSRKVVRNVLSIDKPPPWNILLTRISINQLVDTLDLSRKILMSGKVYDTQKNFFYNFMCNYE